MGNLEERTNNFYEHFVNGTISLCPASSARLKYRFGVDIKKMDEQPLAKGV